ncbi:STAS domain-containing protein [Chitinolyticbacter meiyuanensis]|uniref:STAS domain-containing protein n=1 Tax=Chitinolyticbacter meiyuanensis TaxID=682798 RepID=UPI0011E58F36|nr:STAS domain-containing protein [Chitinolyticbacter meiyuanensis]
MPLTALAEGESAQFRLDGELTIFHAAELKDVLLAALGEGGGPPLTIDLSGVDELDTAGVQLLLLAKREAARHGRALAYSGHSPAVISVLELLDLAGTLGDPVLIPNASR